MILGAQVEKNCLKQPYVSVSDNFKLFLCLLYLIFSPFVSGISFVLINVDIPYTPFCIFADNATGVSLLFPLHGK